MKLREIRDTDERFGHNTAVYRFELHGSMQTTGLDAWLWVSRGNEGVRGLYDIPVKYPLRDYRELGPLCYTL